MMLDPYNQKDHPECKSRPDSGLSAITEIDPGYITGILGGFIHRVLSVVFKAFLRSTFVRIVSAFCIFITSLLSQLRICNYMPIFQDWSSSQSKFLNDLNFYYF